MKHFLLLLILPIFLYAGPNDMWLVFKVGDKRTAPGKEDIGIKDGMLVDYHVGRPTPSNHMKMVFVNARVDKRTWGPRVRRLVQGSLTRPRLGYINLKEFGDALGDPLFTRKQRRRGRINPVVDAFNLPATLLKDIGVVGFNNAPAYDSNAVSSGSYTVGSGAQDYATWAAATADIANLTAALTFTQETDVTETGGSTVTEALGGFTLTFTSDTPQDGDPTTGHLTSLNHAAIGFTMSQDGAGTVVINNLHIKRIAQASAGNADISIQTNATAHTVKIHDCLFNGQSLADRGLINNDVDVTWQVWNLVIWDYDVVGLWVFNTAAGSEFENITINNCVKGFDGNNKTITVQNMVCVNNSTSDFVTVGTGVTGNNNASEDATADDFATAANNIINVVPDSEFVSLTDTDANYLQINPSMALSSGGVAAGLADNTTGIEGNTRPHPNGPSIGAYEIANTWYNTSWNFRNLITILADSVSGTGPIYSFPVLIDSSNLNSNGFFGNIQADGEDIVFTADDGSTKLKRELVTVSNTDSTMELWVKIPGLSPINDNYVYVYYQNSGASETNDVTTWDDAYVMVLHLNDDPNTSTVQDATANNNDGAKDSATNPNEVTGLLNLGNTGKAQAFQDTESDNITVTNTASIDEISLLTIEAVVNVVSFGGSGRLFEKQSNDFRLLFSSPTKFAFEDGSWDTDGKWNHSSMPSATDAYISLTIDRNSTSNNPIMYIDGSSVSVSETTTPAGSKQTSDVDLLIGNSSARDREFDGTADEIRLSNVIRSADWILTGFRSMNNPLGFYDLGAQEDSIVPTNVGLLSPGADSTDVAIDFTFTVLTAADAGVGLHATPYRIEIDDNNDFLSIHDSSGWQADVTWQPSVVLVNNTVYFWRTQSRDLNGNLSVRAGFTVDTAGFGTFTTIAAVAVGNGPKTIADKGRWHSVKKSFRSHWRRSQRRK